MKWITLCKVSLLCGVFCGSNFAPPAALAQQPTKTDASAQAHGVAASAPLPVVKVDGNYFSAGGKRFVPVGVNWVPAKAAMEWPYQWDPAAIEADFAQMHELGVNTVRLDLVWSWFEPRPDDFNPEAFKQMDTLISLANRYKIYLHPEMLIGGEVGEAERALAGSAWTGWLPSAAESPTARADRSPRSRRYERMGYLTINSPMVANG